MRVRIYLAMDRLENAQTVANGMIHARPQEGQSWLSLARVSAVQGQRRGDVEEALEKCFELEESLRLEALEDPIFAVFWQGEN